MPWLSPILTNGSQTSPSLRMPLSNSSRGSPPSGMPSRPRPGRCPRRAPTATSAYPASSMCRCPSHRKPRHPSPAPAPMTTATATQTRASEPIPLSPPTRTLIPPRARVRTWTRNPALPPPVWMRCRLVIPTRSSFPVWPRLPRLSTNPSEPGRPNVPRSRNLPMSQPRRPPTSRSAALWLPSRRIGCIRTSHRPRQLS